MKKVILVFLSFCSICNAQNKQIDSLLNVLKTAKEDTNKIKTLNTLSHKLGSEALYEKAKSYANDALQLSEKINYKRGKAAAYNNIANINHDQGNYSEALKYILETLKIREEIGDKKSIASTLDNAGIIYGLLGNDDEALKNHLASLKIEEETGDKKGMTHSYINIGVVYYMDNKPDEALKYYEAALKISEETGDKYNSATAYNNIGIIYLEKSNYPEALKNELASLKIREELGNKQGVASADINIGVCYDKLKKYALAKEYLHNGLSLAINMGVKESIKNAYASLEDLDSATGNCKQALIDFRMYELYKDSLVNDDITKQTQDMKAKYESEKKEKEITLLTKDNEIQNIEIKKQRLLKYSFIGGLTLVILLLLLGYRTYRARQVLRLQDIRNKIAGDLHDDIGSTLNSISIYSEVARKNDSQRDEALEMIGDSSRKIIDAMSDIVWTINPENDNFAKIIFRMKSLAHNLLRAKNIEYTFHADEALDNKKLSLEDRRNFYLIFKEAINNLVKYSNASRVAITLSKEGEQMKFLIRDNGVGFDMSKENAGNGLKSMRRRADEMKAKFSIESQTGNGTQIELALTA